MDAGATGAGKRQKLNFSKLSAETLRRYKRYYRLNDTANFTKDALALHFSQQHVDEVKVLKAFVESVRRRKAEAARK